MQFFTLNPNLDTELPQNPLKAPKIQIFDFITNFKISENSDLGGKMKNNKNLIITKDFTNTNPKFTCLKNLQIPKIAKIFKKHDFRNFEEYKKTYA